MNGTGTIARSFLLTLCIVSTSAAATGYLAAGRVENFNPYSLLGENRRFRDVLLARDYEVHYANSPAGDFTGFRPIFVEGIIALTHP